MSTEELTKKLKDNASFLRSALESPYGPFVFLALVFVLFGKLSPDQYDQAVRLINEFNNPFGWGLVGWGVLIYVQYAFFRPYLESEKAAVAATEGLKSLLSEFEDVLREFVEKMDSFMGSMVQERRAQDARIHEIQTTLADIIGHVSRLTTQITEHESHDAEFRGEWRSWHDLLRAVNQQDGRMYPPCEPLQPKDPA